MAAFVLGSASSALWKNAWPGFAEVVPVVSVCATAPARGSATAPTAPATSRGRRGRTGISASLAPRCGAAPGLQPALRLQQLVLRRRALLADRDPRRGDRGRTDLDDRAALRDVRLQRGGVLRVDRAGLL